MTGRHLQDTSSTLTWDERAIVESVNEMRPCMQFE